MAERNDQHVVDNLTAPGGEPTFPFTFRFLVSVLARPDLEMTEPDDQPVVHLTDSAEGPTFPFTFSLRTTSNPFSVVIQPVINRTEPNDQSVANSTASGNESAFPIPFIFPTASNPFSAMTQPIIDTTEPNDEPVVNSAASGYECAFPFAFTLPKTSNSHSVITQSILDMTEPKGQSFVNYREPEKEFDSDEATSESQSFVGFTRSEEDFDFDDATSENQSFFSFPGSEEEFDSDEAISEFQSFVSFAGSEEEFDFDKATSRNRAVINVTSTRHRTGILDLPAELRVMIFRHLLIHPDGIDLRFGSSEPLPSLDILRTNRLIHREASEVLYKENRFLNFLGTMLFCLDSRRLVNTIPMMADQIQNIHVKVRLSVTSLAIDDFLTFMPYLGDSSTTRGALTVDFNLGFIGPKWPIPLRWFIRALGRFTNFKTIELHVQTWSSRDDGRIFDVLEHLKLNLEPVLGNVEVLSSEAKDMLRFHPLNHRDRLNRLIEPNNDDWADSLDGLRLEWNEVELATNADDTEMSGGMSEGQT